jgi:hypothetical protein
MVGGRALHAGGAGGPTTSASMVSLRPSRTAAAAGARASMSAVPLPEENIASGGANLLVMPITRSPKQAVVSAHRRHRHGHRGGNGRDSAYDAGSSPGLVPVSPGRGGGGGGASGGVYVVASGSAVASGGDVLLPAYSAPAIARSHRSSTTASSGARDNAVSVGYQRPAPPHGNGGGDRLRPRPPMVPSKEAMI